MTRIENRRRFLARLLALLIALGMPGMDQLLGLAAAYALDYDREVISDADALKPGDVLLPGAGIDDPYNTGVTYQSYPNPFWQSSRYCIDYVFVGGRYGYAERDAAEQEDLVLNKHEESEKLDNGTNSFTFYTHGRTGFVVENNGQLRIYEYIVFREKECGDIGTTFIKDSIQHLVPYASSGKRGGGWEVVSVEQRAYTVKQMNTTSDQNEIVEGENEVTYTILTLQGIDTDHTHQFVRTDDEDNRLNVICESPRCTLDQSKASVWLEFPSTTAYYGDGRDVALKGNEKLLSILHEPTVTYAKGSLQVGRILDITEPGEWTCTYSFPNADTDLFADGGANAISLTKTIKIGTSDISGADVFYHGTVDGVPTFDVYFGDTKLRDGIDYSIETTEGISNGERIFTATVTGKGLFEGTKDFTCGATLTNIALYANRFALTQQSRTFEWDTPFEPQLDADRLGGLLVEGTDFVLSRPGNPVSAGKYAVTVRGIGHYNGEVSLPYWIQPVEASAVTASLTNMSLTYTGAAVYPALDAVQYDGRTLDESDYTISWPATPRESGKYTCEIAFKGNFTGSKLLGFEIVPATLTIAAADTSVKWGETPEFNFTYTDFLGEDTEDVLIRKPNVSCAYPDLTAIEGNTFPITLEQGSAEAKNYTIEYDMTPAALTITDVKLYLPDGVIASPAKEAYDFGKEVTLTLDETARLAENGSLYANGEALTPSADGWHVFMRGEQTITGDIDMTFSLESTCPEIVTVKFTDAEGQTIDKAQPGDVVNIVISVDDGKTVTSVTAKKANGDSIYVEMVESGLYRLTMPAADVTVVVSAAGYQDLASLSNYAELVPVNGENGPVFPYNNGAEIKPTLTITDQISTGETLTEGTDYTLSWSGGVTGMAGSFTDCAVTATAVEGSRYVGSLSVNYFVADGTFTLEGATVNVPNQSLYYINPYTGHVAKATQISYKLWDAPDQIGATVTDANGRALIPRKHYRFSTVDYTNQQSEYDDTIGDRCKVLIEGMGPYEGTSVWSNEFEIIARTGSGSWGGNVTWALTQDGTLTLNGTGDMASADSHADYPWFELAPDITSIVIGEGITSIGNSAFAGTSDVHSYSSVSAVTLPASVTRIGSRAFAFASNLENLSVSGVTNPLSHIESLGGLAFFGSGIRFFTIPDTLRDIGALAFGNTAFVDGYPTFNITYELGGGTNDPGNPRTYNPLQSVALKQPTREGYDFIGWTWQFEGEDATTEPEIAASIDYNNWANVTFTAHWRLETHEVRMAFVGIDDAPSLPAIEFTAETDDFVLTPPELTGYVFNYWKEMPFPGRELLNNPDPAVFTIPKGTRHNVYVNVHMKPLYNIAFRATVNSYTYGSEYATSFDKIVRFRYWIAGLEYRGWRRRGTEDALEPTQMPPAAGEYTMVVYYPGDGYYAPETVEFDFEVSRKKVTVTGLVAQNKPYDGTTEATIDASNANIEGALASDQLSVTAKGQFINAASGPDMTVRLTEITLSGDHADSYTVSEDSYSRPLTASIEYIDTFAKLSAFISAETAIHSQTSLMLNDSVTMAKTEQPIVIPAGKTVSIDMNGKTITGNGETSLFEVYGNLNLISAVKGGRLTGANTAIIVRNGGNAKLNTIGITGNSATNDGGGIRVASGGEVWLGGTSITDNTAANHGGGVYVENGANFIVGGCTISGNSAGNVTENVYLPNGALIKLQGKSYGGSIGVTTEITPTDDAPLTVTDGLNEGESTDFIKSDRAAYGVGVGANHQAALKPLHTVTVNTPQNGGVTVDKATAVEGETVTLIVKPEDGYQLAALTYAVDGGEPVDIADNAFTMPAGNVTVSAAFITIDEWAALIDAIGSAEDGAKLDLIDYDYNHDGRITCPADGSDLNIEKKITLDLTGCVLDRGLTSAKSGGYVIRISEDGDLTVVDSSPDVEHTYTDPITGEPVTVYGGVITGGKNNGNGGGVLNWGTFTMTGGTICGNTAEYDGGGVLNNGTFTMEGSASVAGNTAEYGGGVENYDTFSMSGSAAVTGNTAKSHGGGVYNYQGRTFNMSGSASVTGNKVGEADNNVYLPGGKQITIDGTLTGNVPIGVKMQNPGTFTDGLSGNGTAANFASDDPTYAVGIVDGEAALGEPHNVTIEVTGIGTATADKATAIAGETVSLNIAPANGYALSSLTYTPDGGQATDITEAKSFSMPASDVTVNAVFTQTGPVFAGYRLRLSGILGLRYFMLLPDGFDDAGAQMTFTIEGATQTVTQYVEETLSGITYRVYECGVHAYQMAENITAVFSYGDGQSVTDSYSVRQYLNAITEGDYTGAAKTLVEATCRYGHYIQPYLHDINGSSHEPLDYEGTLDIDAAKAGANGHPYVINHMDNDAVEKAQFFLTVNAGTDLNVTIQLKEGVTGTVTASANGKRSALVPDGGIYKATVRNIAADNLDAQYPFSFELDGVEIFSIDASVLSYARMVLNGESSDNEANAVAALYHYYEAAEAYNDSQDQ